MKAFYIALCLSLFLFSCASDEAATSKNNYPEENMVESTPEEKETDDFPEETKPTFKLDHAKMLKLVNAYRKEGCKCGNKFFRPVPPLVWNDALERAALNHCLDMKRNDFFNHQGSNGSSAGDRIKKMGYTWRAYGENIALGQNTEEAVMRSWINSPPHCENIMSPNYKEMGTASYKRYWTQVFATSF